MTRPNGLYTNYPGYTHFDLMPPGEVDDTSSQARTEQKNGAFITPSIDEVVKLGLEIGVPIVDINIPPGYDKWWHVLHEIGHFAVKPDKYIDVWRRHGALKGVPCMDWHLDLSSGATKSCPTELAIFDPTPNEWGVRAWCLSVLKLKGWRNPIYCDEWPDSSDYEGRRWNNPHVWSETHSRTKHPYMDGFNQLEAVGIDFSKIILRPTRKIGFGWQPVLYWHFRQGV